MTVEIPEDIYCEIILHLDSPTLTKFLSINKKFYCQRYSICKKYIDKYYNRDIFPIKPQFMGRPRLISFKVEADYGLVILKNHSKIIPVTCNNKHICDKVVCCSYTPFDVRCNVNYNRVINIIGHLDDHTIWKINSYESFLECYCYINIYRNNEYIDHFKLIHNPLNMMIVNGKSLFETITEIEFKNEA